MFPRRPPESVPDDESQAEDPPLPEPTKSSAKFEFRSNRARSEMSAAGSEYGESARQPSPNHDYPKNSFIPRTEFIKPKPRSERSVPRSDYALSAARQPSPVRSIASVPDRRSRSPYSARALGSTAQPKGAAEGGTLWSAIKDLPQRRSRIL